MIAPPDETTIVLEPSVIKVDTLFFASTTLLILGGLFAIFGSSETIIAFMNDMPFVANEEKALWEFKLLLIFGIFVYVFFRFTWSLRQHNFCSVLVGTVSISEDDEKKRSNFVLRSARILVLASDTFNCGLRAYYFALANTIMGFKFVDFYDYNSNRCLHSVQKRISFLGFR